MKKLLCLAGALALMLALTAPVVSQAEETTLYMPRKLEKLGVPELPQLPFLKAWSDCIVLGDPCPLVLDPDGYLHVQFSFPVDECLVMHGGGVQFTCFDMNENRQADEPYYAFDGVHVPIDENGRGEVALRFLIDPEEESLSNPRFYVRLGSAIIAYTYTFHRFEADYVTWSPEEVFIFDNQDYFRSGLADPRAVTVYRGEPISRSTVEEWWDWQEYWNWNDHMHVHCVNVTYGAGDEIVGAEAVYWDKEPGTLHGYSVQYLFGEDDHYRIYFAPETESVVTARTWDFPDTVGKYAPTQNVYDEDGNWKATIVHFTQDEPLYGYYWSGGIFARSGSDGNIHKWYTTEDYRLVRKAGPRGVKTFVSPRVK